MTRKSLRLILLACTVLPTLAVLHAQGDPTLRLGPRLRAVLANPELRQPYVDKAGRPVARPLLALQDPQGRIEVDIRVKPGERTDVTSVVSGLGGRIVASVGAMHAIEAWLTPAAISRIAASTAVRVISLPHYALPRSQVISQGDQVLGAAQFRQATGATGKGISVGVISDGATDLQEAISSGNLPSNVWVDPNDSKFGSSGEEGIAMMSIVYALAPGAQLGFCGPQTDVQFVQCLNDFESSGFHANIIVDDLGFPGVDMFGNGSFASAVAQFAQQNPSVHLVTAAGNDAQAYWQGVWAPKTIPTNSTGSSGYTLNGNT